MNGRPRPIRAMDDAQVFDFRLPRAYSAEERWERWHTSPVVDPAGRAGSFIGAWHSTLGRVHRSLFKPKNRKEEAALLVPQMCREYGLEPSASVCRDAVVYARKLAVWTSDPHSAALTAIYAAALSHGHWLVFDLRREIERSVKARLSHLLTRLNLRVSPTRLVQVGIARAVHALGLGGEVEGLALRVWNGWITARPMSGTPTAVAGSAVYVAARVLDKDVRQDDVAKALDRSSQAIRNTLKTYNPAVVYQLPGATVVWRPAEFTINGRRDKSMRYLGLPTPSQLCQLGLCPNRPRVELAAVKVEKNTIIVPLGGRR